MMTPHVVKFVYERDGSESTPDMKTAFEIAAKTEDASWIEYVDVLDLTDADFSTIFVCDKFSGEAFEELKRRKFRIIGPRYVIYCHKNDQRVELLEYPAFMAAMKGLVVCCTNVPRERRLRVHDKVRLMGGRIIKVLTEEATHLVADQASSKKYHLASALNRPIMLSEWVDRCWHDGKSELIHATDESYDKFRCPIFRGLNITVSQLSSSERQKVKELIETNGGNYAGFLKVDITTHLVLNDATGDKFKMAKRKNIYCVKPTWIYKSIENGCCCDEQHYLLGETNLPETSKIKPKTRRNGNSESIVSVKSTVSEMTLNETYLSASKAESLINANAEHFAFDPKKLDAAGQFLDGCKIVLSGFLPATLENLKKVLNKGGATRFDQIDEHVTHVIMGSKSDKHKKILMEGNFRPHVVRVGWLKESINAGKALDESPFSCLELPSAVLISPFKKQAKVKPPAQSRIELEPVKAGDDIGDVLSQYLPTTATKGDDAKMFKGLSFNIHGFDEKDEAAIGDFIVEYGGDVDNKQCDYAVVPLDCTDSPSNSTHTVTYFWLQSCIEDKRVHDVQSHSLYVPIDFDRELRPLSSCVISTSQYEAHEREAIVNLAQLLGAKYQERLSKLNHQNQGLFANTHLITNQASGKKYDGALAWGIPVLSHQWLVECAKAGKKVDETLYLINAPGDIELSKHDFQTSTPMATPNGPIDFPRLSALENSPTAVNDESCSLQQALLKTPYSSNSVTEAEINRIKERIANGYKTPIQPNIQRLLDEENCNNSSLTCAPLDNSIPPGTFLNNPKVLPKLKIRDAMAKFDSPVNVPTKPKQLSETEMMKMFCRGVHKSLRELTDEYGSIIPNRRLSMNEWEKPEVELPLSGLVIVVSKRLENYQIELNKLAESLGAKCRWNYDAKATHLIHEGKSGGHLSKDVGDALSDSKWVVSREWLYACRDQNIRVNESDYPYTYNSRMVLEVSQRPSSRSREPRTPSKSNLANTSEKSCASPAAKPELIASKVDVEMNNLLAAAKVVEQKRSAKTAPPNFNMSSASFFKEGSKKPPPKPRKGSEPDELVAEFESVPVTWDNPQVCDFIPTTSSKVRETEENVSGFQSKRIKECKPKIMIAGGTAQEKQKFLNVVSALAGEISVGREFRPTFTHLVTTSPNYTEKHIASIAKGLWILKKSYLEACSQSGRFVEESEHEWGANEDGDPDSKEYKLAKAAHHWRVKVQNMKKKFEPCGAFRNWKVIIYTDETRVASFQRILEAGGAEIVSARPPFSTVRGVTHAFMEMSKVEDVNIDFVRLVKQNVLCLKCEYITSHLLEDDDVYNYLIPEVVDLMPKRVGKRSSSEDLNSTKKIRSN